MMLCVCLLALKAHALDTTRSIGQFSQTAWTLRNGMPAYVNVLAQTPDGYLWIGASTGLYRFDGFHVEPFAQKLPGVGVVALAIAPNGDLWIGSASGVSRLSEGRLTTFTVPGLDLAWGVRTIAFGRNGEIWVATDQVARFDGQRWEVMDSDWGTSDGFRKPGGVWGLAVAPDGVVWTKNVLNLYFLRPGSKRFMKADNYGGAIFDFARAADGRVWTADMASHRFYALPDLGPSDSPPPPAQVGTVVPEGFVGRIMFDRDGALWCANPATGGVYRMRSPTASKSEIEEFTPADGRRPEAPPRTFEDREGDVWVGAEMDLYRLSPTNIVTEPSISIRAVGAEVAASKDAVYVADGWPPLPSVLGHPKQTIYAISAGAPRRLSIDIGNVTVLNGHGADEVLLASRDVLTRLHGDATTIIPLPKETSGAELISATQHGADVWAVFGDRGLFRRHDDVWTRITAPNLSTNSLTRVRVDGEGSVWLFGADTIERLTADGLRPYSDADGPDIGDINAVVASRGGTLFGGELGAAFFDGREFHTLSRLQAPFLVGVTGIVEDDLDGTWFQTTAGIFRVSTRQLGQALHDPALRLDYRLFDARDGMRSMGSNSQFGTTAVRGPDGRLWFLNFDNVAWIDPHRLERDTIPPAVGIKSIVVDGRPQDLSATKLRAGASSLQIDYAGISLQSPERVTFRYQLEGVDPSWVDAGDRRQAFYTRLGPRNYRFKVIAANVDGVWNTTGASLAFEIPPTFTQSGWFALLCTTLAALVLWLIYSFRMWQVTRAIQKRFEERVTERERIARELHDTLLQGVHGMILKFQAISDEIPDDSPTRETMERALDRADEVLIESRDRVKDLRISPAAGTDLPAAIGAMGAELAKEQSTRFDLSVTGSPRALEPIVQEEALRIVQEALTNAFRHARAAKIETEIIYQRAELRLRVRDDGCGIEGAILDMGRPGHWGLAGMRERAKKIRASFEVQSRPGAGTEIEIRVPARIAYARRR
jgi:signal transduction histidine kinase/streptogramin lyase